MTQLSNPFATLSYQRRAATQPPNLPPLTAEEADSILQQVGRGTLGGLQAVGNVLDTPGSLVRGLLAGDPGRAFGGLLDPSRRVSGRELLEQAGIADRNQPGLFNSLGDFAGDVGGFATEVLTDPLTALSIGPLTKAGIAARNAGTLAPRLAPAIEQGQRSLARVGIPFTQMGVDLGTGARGAALADKFVTPVVDKLKYGNPVGRKLTQLFDRGAAGAYSPEAQRFFSEEMTPAVGAAMNQARLETIPLLRQAKDAGFLDDREAIRAMRQGAEGLGQFPPTAAQDFGSKLSSEVKGMVDDLQARGVNTQELSDEFADYFPRYSHPEQQGVVPGIRDIWDIFRRRADEVRFGRKEALKNIPGGTEQINELVRNRELSSFARTKTDPAVVEDLARQLYGKGVAELADDEAKQVSRLSSYLKRTPRSYSEGAGRDLFNADPVTDLIRRKELQARAVTSTDKLRELVKRTTVEVPTQIAPGDVFVGADGARYVSAADVMQKAGMGFRKMEPVLDDAGKVVSHQASGIGGPDQLARELGIDVKDLARRAVPEQIAGDITRYMESFQSPKPLRGVLAAYDAALDLFRHSLTAPFPAFHARNLMSGIYYNSVAGASDPRFSGPRALAQPITDMFQMLRGKPVGLPSAGPGAILDQAGNAITNPQQLLDEMVAMKVVGRGTQATERTAGVSAAPRLIDPMGVGQRMKGVFREARKARWWERPFVVGQKTGNMVEDLLRGAHYLALRRQGANPESALRSVLNWHFDYSRAGSTPFEKGVMKRVVPFYTFARRNTPLVLGELMRNPGGEMAQTIRAIGQQDQDSGFTPEYIREQSAIPLGPERGGSRRYLTGFGLPVEEPFDRLSFQGMAPDFGRIAEKLVGMTSPAIKAPMEFVSGKQMYSGRPLEDLDPLLGRTIANIAQSTTGAKLDPEMIRNLPGGPLAEYVLANSPASRALSTARTMFDPRKRTDPGAALGLLSNLFTGLKVTDVDTEKAKREAKRRLVERLLESPNVSRLTKPFVPREEMGNLTPEERQLYSAYRVLSR